MSSAGPLQRIYIVSGPPPEAAAAAAYLPPYLELLNLRSGVVTPVTVHAGSTEPGVSTRYPVVVVPKTPLPANEEYGLRLLPNPRYVRPVGDASREELAQFFVGSRPRAHFVRGGHYPGLPFLQDASLSLSFSEGMSLTGLNAPGTFSLRDVQTGEVTELHALDPRDGDNAVVLPLGPKERWHADHRYVLRASRNATSTAGAPLDGKLTWPGAAEDFEFALPSSFPAVIYESLSGAFTYWCDEQRWWTGNGPAAIPPRCRFESRE
ncbi:MAG: hypothetical protein IT371_08815 [Deltaproteobacteria bacterium]|nr:hypothetical protein [Deltaproteobacteria bacterium]